MGANDNRRPRTRCYDGCSTDRPPEKCYVIHPYFIGRDKGAMRVPTPNREPGMATHGDYMLFSSVGRAWYHIITKVQPNDQRAADNYRVVTLGEYLGS